MKRTDLLRIMEERIEQGWSFNQIYDWLCELDEDKRRNKQSSFHGIYK